MAHIGHWPVGPEILGLIAVGAATGGIALAIWGALHDYKKVLDARRLGHWFEVARWTGIVGDVARGLVVLLVAAYVFLAALNHDPKTAKSLGAALQSFAHDPGGPEIVGLLGIGLISFGLYSVAEACFRRSARR